MRVLMVSTSYPHDASDWRGVFIRHLVGAIARIPTVQLSLWSPPGETPIGVSRVTTARESAWLAGLMRAGGIAHLVRSGGVQSLGAPIRLLRMLHNLYRRERAQDIYHVNWLQNALSLPRDGRPLLATVLGTDMHLLKVPGMTWLLRRAFRGRRVAICPNAPWMIAELHRRFGDLADIRCVPFGIDARWFDIERKPATPSQWLCVSRLTEGKLGTLFAWGESAFAHGVRELHLFGPMQESIAVPDWVHYHGAATAESLCNDWFPRARGLITLSQHSEGRPQVMLEAMAAGLPIVASRTAAHEDLLQDRQTGWLCDSAAEVDGALTALNDDPLNRELGQRAREWAKHAIGDWDANALKYVTIYRALLRT